MTAVIAAEYVLEAAIRGEPAVATPALPTAINGNLIMVIYVQHHYGVVSMRHPAGASG